MVRQKKLSNTKLIAANQIIDLISSQKFDKAKQLVRKHFKPDSELSFFFNGWIWQLQGNHDKAIKLFEQSLLKNPINVDTLIGLAGSYLELEQFDRSIECAEHATLLDKNNPKTLLTLATCLSRSDKKNKKIQSRADAILSQAFDQVRDPVYYNKDLLVDILASWGGVLLNLNELEESLLILEQAKSLDPYNVIVHKNLVSVYANFNRIDEAIKSAQVVAMSDDVNLRIDTLYQEGMLELLRENWVRGWRLHEARLQSNRYKYKNLLSKSKIPFESLNETHRVLVFQEQGIGDLLNFIHLIPKVYRKCANIDLVVLPNSFLPINNEVPSPKGLIDHNFSSYVTNILVYGVDRIDLNNYDCVLPLMSLPFHLGIGRYADFKLAPFTAPTKSKIKANIGIFWKGSPHHDNDEQRSLPVEYVNELIRSNTDKTFLSLQIDRDEGLEPHANLIQDKQAVLGLEDLASVIAECDLVITVDSMVAHLAGSLGRPVWILHAFSPDWRWGLESENCIWYPTARNFRQATIGDWRAVIDRVSNELKHSKI